MLQLDVMLKFWELLFALGAMVVIVGGILFVTFGVKRRHTRPKLYVDAGGVVLSMGEESLLEAIARAEGQDQKISALAQTMNTDVKSLHPVALALMQKELVLEVADQPDGSTRLELSPTGYEAALARNYIKLV